MTNSESQPIITAPRTENGKSGISRSFAENRSSNDKQMRRKSAGNALLKLFRSREGSPEKPSLRVADEEEAYKRNLEEDTRAKNFSENIMYPGPHSSPQMRRNPPPPYRDPRLAYQQQPPSHPPQPHFHQRMYSANETSNSQNYNGKDAFLRYERHRYSGGRLPSAITSIPITYHSHRGRPSGAPTYPTAQPSFPIDEGNRNVPSYQNPLVDREQFATNNTDYYDAFNAWFAYSGRVGSGQSAIAASTAASLSSGSGRSAFSAVNQTRAPPHFNPYSSIQAIEGNGNAYVGNPAAPARQPPATAAIGQAYRYPPPQGAPTKFATGNQNVHVQLPIHRF
uniref:Uncharacterized protein n=1 Tax=Acrobeloides nanus TaxID=290746 RepID=A0A914DNL1_9BILA